MAAYFPGEYSTSSTDGLHNRSRPVYEMYYSADAFPKVVFTCLTRKGIKDSAIEDIKKQVFF
jgi:hypothetical protein